MDASDQVDPTIDDTNRLIQAVHRELLALRGAFGELNEQKFSQYPTLRTVCGGNDLADDYRVFEREMKRIVDEANRDEAAAALSITAPQALMLRRLSYVVEHFPNESGEVRDQRTGRRWSDRGMPNIATELVHLAKQKGWLGRENLALELSGTREGLCLTVWYYFSEDLDGQPPVVSIWKIVGSDVTEESIDVERNLSEFKTVEVEYKGYRLEQYRIKIDLPESLTRSEQTDENTSVLISIDTVGAPMRTLVFADETDVGNDLKVEFSVYREIAMIEVRRRAPDLFARVLELQPS
jgi:hypothetical protein